MGDSFHSMSVILNTYLDIFLVFVATVMFSVSLPRWDSGHLPNPL